MSAISLLTRSRIRRGWLGLVAVGVLGGVVGGLASGAIAGERRGASAAERLIVETRAPELTVAVNSADPADNDMVVAAIRVQPGTAAVWSLKRFIGRTTEDKDWYFPLAGPARPPELYRPLVDEGRLPNDDAVDELAITRQTSLNTGLAVGDSFALDLYAPDELETAFSDSEFQPTGGRLRMRVVGILRDPSDIAASRTQHVMLGSKALYESYPGTGKLVLVKLRPGTTVETFQRQLRAALPPTLIDVSPLGDALVAAEPSIHVIQVGLWIMACVIAATGLLLVNQMVRRRVTEYALENATLRSLGLDRRQRVLAAAAPGFPAAFGAAAGCVLVAVGVSPLFPVGRPRALDPSLGIDLNIAVVALGAALTGVVVALSFLSAAAGTMRVRSAPPPPRTSTLMARIGQLAPVSIGLGIGLSADRGVDRTQRSIVRGVGTIVVGIVGLVASLTWITSLDHLTRTPAAFGTDYDLLMEVPVAKNAERTAELVADPSIEMVAQIANGPIELSGRPSSATAFDYDKGTLRPLVLRGRLPAGPTEISLGPRLAEDLGVSVGSVIELDAKGAKRPVEVVGITLDPRVTAEEYAGGVFMTPDLLADVSLAPPYVVTVVRFAPAVDGEALRAALDDRYPWGVIDESVPAPPAPIINLSDVRIVPAALAWYFGAVAVVSLISAILGAARRHRHTLAIARALGLRPAQMRSAMRALALSILVVAGVIGVIVGAALGNAVWAAVARGVDVLAIVRWPVGPILLGGLALTVVAVVASTWSARHLASRSAARALAAE